VNRRTLSIYGGVCAVLAVAWFMLLWSPKSSELASAKTRQTAAETKAAELESKVARLQASLQRSPELQADLDRVRSAVPTTADLPQFILDTDDAASRAGVDFLSITPTPPSPGVGGPTEVKISMTIKGGYQPVLDFLDNLLTMRRLVVIDQTTITPDEANLNVALQGRMFTTALPAAPPGAATAAPAAATTTPTTGAPS
jgi:Tfp pilus assembly protein PilO